MLGLDNCKLFDLYVKNKNKAVFPWSLSIVDCFFIVNAFQSFAKNNKKIQLSRISDCGKRIEIAILSNAYDLYGIDSDAAGFEVVLIDCESGACCYWDIHERFVAIAGPEEFISIARPFPDDIEKHRYVEAMLYLEESGSHENPESIYDSVKNA